MSSETAVAVETLIGEGTVLLSLHGHVGHIHLNAPQSANGLDNDTLPALHVALMACHGERRIRAVLLTGEGKNFCAELKIFILGKELFFRNIDFFIDFQLPINSDFSFEISNEKKHRILNFHSHFDFPAMLVVCG